ncbi:MAG TPA: helix-turn-helix domain-containing protein [Candidatus Saccharimonadales bacterium]|nr:helix-turn-helix domain-containing protein [Candidatus Saccharimonadales bacterium]
MLTDVGAVRNYFAKLGLESEIADIYLALHAHGPQTIAALARTSGVERTRIYRLIDRLLESNLIEVETHYKRGVIKAAPIANLHILITQREQELRSLQDELGLIEQVLARNSLSDPSTRVQFYKGPEGYKQMLWNETNARSEVLCLLYENMQVKTKAAFLERWMQKSNENGVRYRAMGSDTFLKSQKEWYSQHDNEQLKHWDFRYVSPTLFKITQSCDVYDDVVAYYSWKDNEIFGIEIHNKETAAQQRQLFELLWDKSTPQHDELTK